MHRGDSIENVISATVEGILRHKPMGQTHALVVDIDYRIDADGDPRNQDIAIGCHLLINAQDNYVLMALGVDDYFPGRANPDTKFSVVSHHYSCWRSDGFHFLNDIFRCWVNNDNRYGVEDLYDASNFEIKRDSATFNISVSNIRLVPFRKLKNLTVDHHGDEKPFVRG